MTVAIDSEYTNLFESIKTVAVSICCVSLPLIDDRKTYRSQNNHLHGTPRHQASPASMSSDETAVAVCRPSESYALTGEVCDGSTLALGPSYQPALSHHEDSKQLQTLGFVAASREPDMSQ